MADKPAKKSPAGKAGFVKKLVADPTAPPETLLLQGYPGDSSEEGHTRLYFDLELRDYVEVPDGAILHSEGPAQGAGPLAPSLIWIDRNAEVVHGQAGTERLRARFLEGRIQQQHLRGAGGGGGQMTHSNDSRCCTPPPPGGDCGPGDTVWPQDTRCCHPSVQCPGPGYGYGYLTSGPGMGTQCCAKTQHHADCGGYGDYAGAVTAPQGDSRCCNKTPHVPCYGGYGGTSWVGTQCCTHYVHPPGAAAMAQQGTQWGGGYYGGVRLDTSDAATQCCTGPLPRGVKLDTSDVATQCCTGPPPRGVRLDTSDVATQCCTNPPPRHVATALCLPTAWPICWR